MSQSLLVRGLVQRLEANDYKALSTPFRVASVDFDFTAALLGTGGRSLDLILIVDTATGDFGDRDAASVRQRVHSLSRAFDVTQSRYLLTVILAGASLASLVEALSPICRVLSIEDAALGADGVPSSAEALEALDDHIRLLLPLDLQLDDNVEATAPADPIAELLAALPTDLDQELLTGLAAASIRGDGAVTRALAKRVGEVLVLEPGA
ncbi:hypothetical protein [Sphingobium sp. KCTC 72723]|uniref:hypothetical protein n=1 Tax=Sphingobium sp. KCTC 72723 TaxID=2733867 RepID=UPI00165E5FC3|nr:hypothetical protein [Sphingobium sp. KCTC 72723]